VSGQTRKIVLAALIALNIIAIAAMWIGVVSGRSALWLVSLAVILVSAGGILAVRPR
jgi:hypothetical protein